MHSHLALYLRVRFSSPIQFSMFILAPPRQPSVAKTFLRTRGVSSYSQFVFAKIERSIEPRLQGTLSSFTAPKRFAKAGISLRE